MGMRHFDVQLIGGMVLHGGAIAEMRTGEGKTLTGDARRRAQRAGRQGRARRHGQRLPGPPRRRVDEPDLRRRSGSPSASCRTCSPTRRSSAAYAGDVTYGTNSEFGFDYLRDNMATALEEKVQRGRRETAPFAHTSHRRRGRQHPHRRGAHAADHLRRARAGRRPLRAVRQARAARWTPGKKPEGMDPRTKKEFVADFDFEFDEKHKTVAVTERASPRPSSSSASTTSTAPRTATWSTT